MADIVFKITDNIINYVAEINNKLGKLETSFVKKNLYLRKISKIRSVNSSCAIEANTLTEKEVLGVIDGKRVIAPPNEIVEVKNAYNAYQKIGEYKPYDIKSFLSAHRYLTENLITDPGEFRKGDIAVYDNDEVIHVGARPEFVYKLIDDLLAWGNSAELNALIKACIIHYEIEIIHPFSDANGRIGRLWQSVILYNYNRLFELIPIETLVYENQERYYEVIKVSKKNNSSTIFIEFMLEMISKTIDSFMGDAYKAYKISEKYLSKLTQKQKSFLYVIVSNFSANDYISMDKLEILTDKAKSTIRGYLKVYTDLNILISTGENKGRKYIINKDIFI